MEYERYEDMLALAPYSLGKEEKHRILSGRLLALSKRHYRSCAEYKKIVDAFGIDLSQINSYYDLPFLPVRLFKELDLRSVPEEEVVKTVTSSGTTGQKASKIRLDGGTAGNQQRTLAKIVSSFIGRTRMPMLVIDSPSVLKDRDKFTARGAGILGFSVFGRDRAYALKDDMELDAEAVMAFLEKHEGEKVLLFGFTFIIWKHFYKELLRLRQEGISLDLSEGILIHGGGWKKLEGEAVSREEFRHELERACGIRKIHDYYGMAEQTGSIYMECECGHLHASVFSDVIVRRPEDFSVCGIGEKGIIQVVSAIPESYPGHSLLTEDEGVILGEDDCPCGRKGNYFSVSGRLKNAEIRGCSDAYGADEGEGLSDEKFPGARASDMAASGRVSERLAGKVRFRIGDESAIERMPGLPAGEPFAEDRIDFLNQVSQELLADREARGYPDVATFAFWIRRANMERERKRLLSDGRLRMGRGVAFHVAPSNVAVNYAYSFAAGFALGNANIVRLPSREFAQAELVNRKIQSVLDRPEYEKWNDYLAFLQYERSREINDYFSSICDVRVVWGGDRTIREIRKSELRPRAGEITFADRYSIGIIDADEYLETEDKDRVARDFYNDTYLTDQNACTSPMLVCWLGGAETIRRAKEAFWEKLWNMVAENYACQPVRHVDKLVNGCMAAVGVEGIRMVRMRDNRIVRMETERLDPAIQEYRGNSGFFYEYEMRDVMELVPLCGERLQTVTMLGNREKLTPLIRSGVKGIDRVVEIGKSMEFGFAWDGIDLGERMTRMIGK